MSLWNIWSYASSLSNNITVNFHWVSGKPGLPGNEHADTLAKAGASLPAAAIPCPLLPVIAKNCYLQYHNWRRQIPDSFLNCQVFQVSWRSSSYPVQYAVIRFPAFAATTTASYCRQTYTGSVVRRTPHAMPVVIIHRISIISSLTVLSLSLSANLSLDLLFLFSTYGSDLGVWPNCWVFAEFLCTQGVG